MLTAIDHAHDLLRGLHGIADAVLEAGPTRAPAGLAAAGELEEQLRACMERLDLGETARDVAHRFLLAYRDSLRATSEVSVRSLGDASDERLASRRRRASEAHTRSVATLAGVATLLRDAQRANSVLARPPHHAPLMA